MPFNFDLEDNSDTIKNELQEVKERILNLVGIQWLKNAVYIVTSRYTTVSRKGSGIVDTGRLRGSLSYVTKTAKDDNAVAENEPDDFVDSGAGEDELLVGSNVPYAEDVETGDGQSLGPRPFLAPSITEFKDEYKELAEMAMRGEI